MQLWVQHKKGWVCKNICYYRNEPITAAALSEDESILVLGHTAGKSFYFKYLYMCEAMLWYYKLFSLLDVKAGMRSERA